ncbi:MAG TPA: S8 family serine peptidase [Capillimicrobium sp.]|jgi:subtilisin family serine protease
MKRLASFTALAAVTLSASLATAGPASADDQQAQTRTYVVLYEQGASNADARAAIAAAGGRVVSENAKLGVATVEAPATGFESQAADSAPLVGAAPNDPIGGVPADRKKAERELERMSDARAGAGPVAQGKLKAPFSPVAGDPLAELQWDMRMINATPDGSYRVERGSRDVRVGIIDTGVDGSHPDIAPNFNRELSRNFTTDDPVVDGACAEDPDGSCADPADVDENGHGTHVAGTIGSPLNGIGIGGVAPGVELVNLRAGQDSGYFFLGPTLDALTYAGDNGIDVVNMSYYVDPWLFNCAANPSDSPAEQREQQLVIAATQRALDYAFARGVTLIAAAGNGNTDLGKPVEDPSSPDYPPGAERTRQIDNSCLNMPTEGRGVIAVTSVGPSERKAYYSDYGVEQADVSAPGGDRRDFFGTDRHLSPTNTILAPYPEALGRATGEIDSNGQPTTAFVVADCSAGPCSYYQYLQGTSMAAPHAAGVAALIVARYGKRDKAHGGVTLDPATVESVLKRTARDTPCPAQNPLDYPDDVLGPEYTALCEGDASFNGFYGEGIVDAAAAVGGKKPKKEK